MIIQGKAKFEDLSVGDYLFVGKTEYTIAELDKEKRLVRGLTYKNEYSDNLETTRDIDGFELHMFTAYKINKVLDWKARFENEI